MRFTWYLDWKFCLLSLWVSVVGKKLVFYFWVASTIFHNLVSVPTLGCCKFLEIGSIGRIPLAYLFKVLCVLRKWNGRWNFHSNKESCKEYELSGDDCWERKSAICWWRRKGLYFLNSLWCLSLMFVKVFFRAHFLLQILGKDLLGLGLKSPLTKYDRIYALPMLTVKDDKGNLFIVTRK